MPTGTGARPFSSIADPNFQACELILDQFLSLTGLDSNSVLVEMISKQQFRDERAIIA